NHPLLDVDTKGATGCLLHITGGTDMSLHEAEQIASSLTYELDSHANVIWGARVKKEYEGKVRCMAIMTGIHSAQIMGPKGDSMPMRNSASSVEEKIKVAVASTRNNSRNRGSIIDQIL
ncbi:MAG: cell division protein FtsZ, partial [Candidatus Methanoperedens sp.]